MDYPERFGSVEELENFLSRPTEGLIDMMKRIDGDVMILGIAGKMGVTMGRQALNAVRAAGVSKKVIGVSRFSKKEEREKLESWGIETIACDLLDREAVEKLPRVKNLVILAGGKASVGTGGSEAQTCVMDIPASSYACAHFRERRIRRFSEKIEKSKERVLTNPEKFV